MNAVVEIANKNKKASKCTEYAIPTSVFKEIGAFKHDTTIMPRTCWKNFLIISAH